MSDFDDKATVTGAIASFNNGADEVPVDSGTFYIAPSQSGTGTPSPSNPRPIVGYTGMTIQHTGKNLLNYADITDSYKITSITDNGNGSFTVVGSNNGAWIQHIVPVKAGQAYSIKCASATNDEGNASQIGVVDVWDGTDTTATKLLDGASITNRKGFTPTGNYVLVRNRVTGGSGAGTGTINQPQLEIGTTATSFEAYKAKTPIVDAFGRTIYGGERSTDGTLTETWEAITFDGSDDENWQTGVVGTYRRTFLSRTLKTTNCYANMLCDKMEASTDSENVDRGFSCRSTNYDSDRLYIFVPLSETSITDVTTFKTWLSNNPITICYPPNTPNEYSLSPISLSTYYGDNNVWCDTGDTEVTYYKSGYGFTSVTVNQKDGNDELIATKTAKLHKVIYGGEVDVIKGTAKPKNLLPNKTYQRLPNNLRLGTDTLDGRLSMKAGTYTLSFDCDVSIGQVYYVLEGGTAVSINATTSGTKVSGSFTLSNDTDDIFLYVYRSAGITDENVSNLMLESSSSASDYVPHFEPFTFPPISMETVEGLNVLYANEGDSTITYRKSAD